MLIRVMELRKTGDTAHFFRTLDFLGESSPDQDVRTRKIYRGLWLIASPGVKIDYFAPIYEVLRILSGLMKTRLQFSVL